MLKRESVALVVIDFQEKLVPVIAGAEAAVACTNRLIRFARTLDVPILWTEQYPKGLGATVDAVAQELEGIEVLEKTSFGCMGDLGFRKALEGTGKTQLLVTGIEAHVCVMQTVLAALHEGFEVFVVRDATSSQAEAEHEAGLARMAAAGAEIVTTQMAMFEILREAGTPEFKQEMKLLK